MRWSNRYQKLATEFLDGPEWAASTGRTAKIESLTVLLARVRDEAVSTANPPRKSLLWWFKPRQIKVGDAVLVKAKVYELMDNGYNLRRHRGRQRDHGDQVQPGGCEGRFPVSEQRDKEVGHPGSE